MGAAVNIGKLFEGCARLRRLRMAEPRHDKQSFDTLHLRSPSSQAGQSIRTASHD